MASITDNKYMQFVINHYPEIKSLNDLVEYTRKNLPPLVSRELVQAILDLEYDYFRENGLYVANEKSQQAVWWCDQKIYDMEAHIGPFFGFQYDLDWFDIEARDPEDAIDLYLYVATEGIKSTKAKYAYIDQWIEILRANEMKLRRSGLILWYKDQSLDYSDPYLVSYPLYKEMRLETISEKENLRQQFQEAVKTFTTTILPILRETKIS